MEELNELIEFVTETHFDDLPAEVVARAKITIMDTVGAILGGGRLPEVTALGRLATRSSSEHAVTLVGRGDKADVAWACLYHGTAGTSLELDEGHARSKGHPAIHALPPALSLGEQHGAPGWDVLAAFVLGYELAARVGSGTNLRTGAHPHGTWGTLGAATAAAKLLYSLGVRPDTSLIGESIRVASNLTIAASFRAAYDGASVRNTYAGVGAKLGLLAAELAGCGFTGESHGPATVFGQIMADDFNPRALVEGLGESYEITRGYFKLHACCRYNHAALDALLQLKAQHSLDVEEIRRVEVTSYYQAAQLRDPMPASPLGARFSIPFALATALINDTTGPAAYEQGMIEHPEILELAQRVEVREEPAFTRMMPGHRPAQVTLHLTGDRVLSQTVYDAKGDPAQPLSENELVTKYFDLAAPALGRSKAEQALETIRRLDTLEDIRELTQWLTS